MQTQITWRDVDQSDAIEADIREKIHKLEQFFDKIVGCKVAVEASHRRHHKGNLYRIHIIVEVPDHEIVVPEIPASITRMRTSTSPFATRSMLPVANCRITSTNDAVR